LNIEIFFRREDMKVLLTLVFAAAIMGLCASYGTVQGKEHPHSEHPTSDHSKGDAAREEHAKSDHAKSEHPESEHSKGDAAREEHSKSKQHNHKAEHPK
jgi:hypothetical protein